MQALRLRHSVYFIRAKVRIVSDLYTELWNIEFFNSVLICEILILCIWKLFRYREVATRSFTDKKSTTFFYNWHK